MNIPLDPAQIIKSRFAEVFLETDGVGHFGIAQIYLIGALDYLHLSEHERDEREKTPPILTFSGWEEAKRKKIQEFWCSKDKEQRIRDMVGWCNRALDNTDGERILKEPCSQFQALRQSLSLAESGPEFIRKQLAVREFPFFRTPEG